MKFNEFKYEHLNVEDIINAYKECLKKLNEAKDAKEFRNIFDEFNKYRGHIDSERTLCSIRHTINTIDEFYTKEQDYWDEVNPRIQEYEVLFAKTILECKFKDELGIPASYFKMAEYSLKQFSPAIIEDLQEENKLANEYGKLKAGAKIEFNGETHNLASIGKYLDSDDRDVRRKAYAAVNDFYTANEDKFDDIYDKLVKVRDKIAKKLGYKNFIELAYIRMMRLDYNAEMVENYRKQVIKDIVPLTVKLRKQQAKRIGVPKIEIYDKAYNFKTGNPKPLGDIEELKLKALQLYSELSPETKEYFKVMIDEDLFDLPTRPNKEMGGYCTGIYDYQVPFIFSNANGTTGDVDTLTHEAGHAFQAYRTMRKVNIPDLCFPTMETAEIHSMSMEFFAHPWSHLFFGKDAEKYHYMHTADSISFLPYGCLVDHFQHAVFENPEMTPQERKATWRKLEKIYLPDIEYSEFPLLERGGYFFRQNHIFQSPFYYIDYTLAQVCALQFYVRTLNKDENAWKDYVKICEYGGTKTFVETVKEAHLKVPFEDGCLTEVAKRIEEELASIDDTKL